MSMDNRHNPYHLNTIQYALIIIRRFWMVIVLLPLLVGGTSFVLLGFQSPRYRSTARILVGTQSLSLPARQLDLPSLDRHYAWRNAEFVLDDLAQVLQSTTVAQDVQAWIGEHYQQSLAVEDIRGRITVTILHRAATLDAVAATPEHATMILSGAIACLQANGLQYWQGTPRASLAHDDPGRDGKEAAELRIAVLDPPSAPVRLNGLSWVLKQSAMRAGLALAAAIGFAFLLNTLDNTLRDARQVKEWIGVPIVGVIPE